MVTQESLIYFLHLGKKSGVCQESGVSHRGGKMFKRTRGDIFGIVFRDSCCFFSDRTFVSEREPA